MIVRALSFHAGYACRHSGACCTARWPIQREAHPDPRVNGQILSFQDRTIAALSRRSAIRHFDGESLPVSDHGCVFHDAGARRCTLQQAFGHAALPEACRQFPRVTVLEPDVAKVTLSCFCPTAVAMLDESPGEPIQIVDLPSPVADGVSGLDARTSLPPALRPDLLFDWESWNEFERRAVALCNADAPLADIVSMLGEIVSDIQCWRIGSGALRDAVHAAFDRAHAAHPVIYERRPGAPGSRRFLACHVFANWTAHLGSSLQAWLRSIETVPFLLNEGWEIRDVDLWLRHYADPRKLAASWVRPPFNQSPVTR